MKKYFCLLLLTIVSVCYSYGQTIVTGVVKEDNKETLPGASVRIKGSTQGVITDLNGKFSITVQNPLTDTLVISSVGMKSLEVPLKGRTSGIDISLDTDLTQLDDVVVIGYGTSKRKDLTGAVSSLSSEVIKDLPVSSISQALAGRLAGVNVQTTDGSPDASITIRVRGGGSITQSNEPLYIVDGFRVSTINNIAPRDIASIDVLKDASSTAIYGSEGANGVVIVTTKSGKSGKITVNFNAYYTSKKAYNLPKVLDPYEYVYNQREIDQGDAWTTYYGPWEDVSIYKSMKGRDWVNKIFNNPTTQQNYNLSVTGGSEALNFNLSLTHNDEGYIMDNSHLRKENISFKTNAKINDRISLDFTDRLSYNKITGPPIKGGLLKNCVQFSPVNTLTEMGEAALNGADDVSLDALGNLANPVASIQNAYKQQYQFDNTFNTGLTLKIFKDLTYRGQISYNFKRYYTDEIWTKNTGTANSNGGFPVADRTEVKGEAYSYSNTLSFNHQFNIYNRLDMTIGQESSHTQDNQMVSESKFYPMDMSANEILAMWNYGTSQPTYTTIGEPTHIMSYFGRINYSLKERYLFTLTARRDGKSVFAPGKRWGTFPGAAFAWRISDEPFLKNISFVSNTLSNLKLRLSYGEVGNARVGSYWRQDWSFETAANKLAYFNSGSSESNVASAMKSKTTMYNDQLQWESKIERNLGVDFGLFKDRISGTVEVYKESMKNLILLMPLPGSSGYSNQYQNAGQTSNHGVEFTLSGILIDHKNFKLNASFNIGFNKNIVDKYVVARQTVSSGVGYYTSPNDYVVEEGQPVGQMIGYAVDGIYTFDDFYWNNTEKKWNLYGGKVSDQSLLTTAGNLFGPGFIKLKDMDGDGTITESGTTTNGVTTKGDKVVIGNAQPKHVGGFNLTARWKGFDLSTLFNWVYGNDIYNVNKIIFNTYSGSKKYNNITPLFSLDKRFTTIDPETGQNIMFGTYANPAKLQEINKNKTMWNPNINSTVPLSWAVEDGSFLRLSSLTLGYTLPESISKRLFISNLRIYGTIYNVFCLTKYTGQDPEVSTSSNVLCPGMDYSAYPKSRSFTMGINMSF